MPFSDHLHLRFSRRIALLAWGKWAAFPLLPLLALWGLRNGRWALFAVMCFMLFSAIKAWEASARRQFVREARWPAFLATKLRAKYPQLSCADADLVLRGLRQFFMAHLRSNRAFVAMPSQVADAVWHEFISHTRGY